VSGAEAKNDRYGLERGVRDGVGLTGLGVMGAGLWMRDPSLALVVIGGLLFGVVAATTLIRELKPGA